MKNVNKAMVEVEQMLDRVFKEAESPIKSVLSFVRKHKRMIFTLALVYVVFKYMFADDVKKEEEYTEDEE